MSSQAQPKIQPHTHCKICGRSIPVNKVHCSPECREKDEKSKKQSKRTSKIYMIVFAVMILMFFLLPILISPPTAPRT